MTGSEMKKQISKRSMLDDLLAVKERLLAVDARELGAEERTSLADQLDAVSVAILRIESVNIAKLDTKARQSASELQDATQRLKSDLAGARNDIDAIKALSQCLGVVTNGVKLLI
jgi:hypothetical protein